MNKTFINGVMAAAAVICLFPATGSASALFNLSTNPGSIASSSVSVGSATLDFTTLVFGSTTLTSAFVESYSWSSAGGGVGTLTIKTGASVTGGSGLSANETFITITETGAPNLLPTNSPAAVDLYSGVTAISVTSDFKTDLGLSSLTPATSLFASTASGGTNFAVTANNGTVSSITTQLSLAPEPSSLSMMGLALLGACIFRRTGKNSPRIRSSGKTVGLWNRTLPAIKQVKITMNLTRVTRRLSVLAVAMSATALLSFAAISTPQPVVAPALQLADASGNSVTLDSAGTVQYTGTCSASTCQNSPLLGSGFLGFTKITIGNFSVLNVFGETKPLLPIATPGLDLGLGSVSAASGGVLSVFWTDTGFSATGPFNYTIQNSGGSASYSTYVDSTGVAFGQGTLVGTVPGVTANINASFNLTVTTQPVSMTQVAVITIPAGGTFTNDFQLMATASTSGGGTQCTSNCTTGTPLVKNDTATIGFWHNKNGQALIDSLNGGSTAHNLANWLASSFPYLYGANSANNLTGKTNADVAALFLTFFGAGGQKTSAQILSGALAAYVTNSTLAGTSASKYGFNVSTTGTGSKTYNVGTDGTAAGLINGQSYSVGQLLVQANSTTQMGTFNANAFNDIFNGINTTGDIS